MSSPVNSGMIFQVYHREVYGTVQSVLVLVFFLIVYGSYPWYVDWAREYAADATFVTLIPVLNMNTHVTEYHNSDSGCDLTRLI